MSTFNLPTSAAPSASLADKGSSATVSGSVSRNVSTLVDGSKALSADAGMKDLVLQRIQKLPPLPKTIADIYEFKKSGNPDTQALLRIIETDPMIVASLLRISNSVLYSSSREIKKLSDVLTMLGYRTIINVAICSGISGHLKPNLAPYGMSIETFTENAALQSAIVEAWPDPKISPIRGSLQLAAFLQEVGIIVLSKLAIEKELAPELKAALSENPDRGIVEESVFGFSTAAVTSLVFSEWKFNQDMIDCIRWSDRPEWSEPSALIGSQVLKIVKTLVPAGRPPMTAESIAKAREYAKEYGFDESAFERMIDRFASKLE